MLIVGLLVSAVICKVLRRHHSPSYNKRKLNQLPQRRAEVVAEIAGQISTLKSGQKDKSRVTVDICLSATDASGA